jgi:hypothetical protein
VGIVEHCWYLSLLYSVTTLQPGRHQHEEVRYSARNSRIVAGLVVVSAFAVAPVAAQVADTVANGTLTGGLLSNTAPISAFGATLTEVTQAVDTAVGGRNVIDATGTNAGYSVTVSGGYRGQR